MVLRALSEELGTPLPYDSLDEVRTRLAEIAPHLVRYDHIETGSFDRLALTDSGDRQVSGALLTENILSVEGTGQLAFTMKTSSPNTITDLETRHLPSLA